MILDSPLLSERYFFPRRAAVPNPFWVECDGARLSCHRDARHAGGYTFLHFHGNGEIVTDYCFDYAPAVAELGVNVVLAEYRGYGASTGRPALASMLGDTGAIVRALGVPEEKLIVYGRSIGSIYAIECAARHPRIAGLVLESGIADPLDRVLLRVSPEELGVSLDELRKEISSVLDHEKKLAAYTGPLLILHTEHDGIIDRSHADRMEAWCGSRDKQKHIFAQGNHNTILGTNWNEYIDLLRRFLDHIGAR
jgi:pimeloyl-ACP methyl ester carboxylesterase